MGIRKLISAFAALALAASSLGAMAITASADETELSFSENYLTMTQTELNEVVAKYTVTADETSNYTLSATAADEDAGTEATGIVWNYNARKQSGYAQRDFDSAYKGQITVSGTWNTGTTTQGYGSYTYLSFVDEDGNNIMSLRASRSDKYYGYVAGENDLVKVASSTTSTDVDVAFSFTYDSTARTVSAITVGSSTSTAAVSTAASSLAALRQGNLYGGTDPKGRGSRTVTLKALNLTGTLVTGTVDANFKVEYVTSGGTKLNTTATGTGTEGKSPVLTASMTDPFVEDEVKYTYVSDDSEDITLSSEETKTVTVTVKGHKNVSKVTIPYQADGSTVATGEYSLSDAYVDDEITYYQQAYVIGDDGALYKNDSTTYGKSVTLNTAGAQEGDSATVTKAYESGTYQFYEDDDSDQYGHPSYASNGKAHCVGASTMTVFTAAEAGKYTLLIVPATCNGGGGGSITITAAETDLETFDPSNYASRDNVKTYTDVTLGAGDTVTVTGTKSYIGVDYAVLVKTADVVTTEDKGYTFDDLKVSDVSDKTLKVSGTDSEKGAFSGEKAVSELISGTSDFSEDTNLVFGLIISDVPETATITSIVIE